MNTISQRSPYYDFLRMISALAVVMIHIVSATTKIASESMARETIILYEAIHSSMNWAVPIFTMISGAIFLGNDEEYTFKRMFFYVKKIALFLLTFGVFFSLLEIVFDEKRIALLQIPHAVLNVLTGQTWAHLWYLYMIIGLYIITPILKPFVKTNPIGMVRQALIVLFLFNSVIPVFCEWLQIPNAFQLQLASIYPFYYIFGAYLSKIDISERRLRFAWLLAFLSLLALIFATILSFTADTKFHIFTSYASFVVVVFAYSVFVIGRATISGASEKWSVRFRGLSGLTFGVFMLHPLFINLSYKLFKLTPLIFPPLIGIPLFFFIVTLLSILSTIILKRIPFVRRYL